MSLNTHRPNYTFLPPWIMKNRLAHDNNPEDARLCYQHIQLLLDKHSRSDDNPALSEPGYPAEKRSADNPPAAHRRVIHLKNMTVVPDLYYREDKKAKNPQYTTTIKSDADTDNMFEYLEIIYTFFADVFDYGSFDNHNATISAMTHYGRGYCNAFWNGTHLVFGAGDLITSSSPLFMSFAQLDIATHEYGHAVIDHLSPLTYSRQSGALNESVCDVFTVMLAHYQQQHKSHEGDWSIGRTLFTKSSGIKALRSLSAPGSAYNHPAIGRDKQISHMRDYIELPDNAENDNGGVHRYSGIPNHAFYHFATALGGYSWEVAGQVWFDTLRHANLPPECDFLTFARETVRIARDNYGDDVADILLNAWDAVGLNPQI
ncbi:M4 family metallopeptidase [Morganella psychrotolerans]|uniref:Neutral metalloproteinase n=1 Tax=Morganella psychrotolerans TaxID=368603 RepID=A0A1B8H0D9_9GAMM|nr:M4 family metallopeptidase [Morganella psychrotolerans]OBU02557.1 metalloprotease [Morganella psychrotolerans]